MSRPKVFVLFVLLSSLAAAPAAAQSGGLLDINVPVSGVFVPTLPLDAAGKPFIDYQFVAQAPGSYQFDLVSSNTAAYDPYLVLLQNGGQIAANDDGGGALNSRIVRVLEPGFYTIRVTRFGSGPVGMPVPFTVSITAALLPSSPVVSPSPLGQPLTDSHARVLVSQYYNSQGEFAGQYAMSISQTRVVPTGPTSAQFHVRYYYTCVRSRCQGASNGVDQRIFYFQLYGNQWQIVQMGGHMSASF